MTAQIDPTTLAVQTAQARRQVEAQECNAWYQQQQLLADRDPQAVREEWLRQGLAIDVAFEQQVEPWRQHYLAANPGQTLPGFLTPGFQSFSVKQQALKTAGALPLTPFAATAVRTNSPDGNMAGGVLENNLIVPDLSEVNGLIPADPNGTPFFLSLNPVDDPAGGISYDRWKMLIANPETRAMLGFDDKAASWLMRSEEGAFMWYQQALANEQQDAALQTQQAMHQIETHMNEGFKYANLAGIIGAVVLAGGLFFIFTG